MPDESNLPPEVADRLRAAHAGVVRGLEAEPVLEELRAAKGAFSQYGYQDHAVLFHGEALDHLAAIVSLLTRSALAVDPIHVRQ